MKLGTALGALVVACALTACVLPASTPPADTPTSRAAGTQLPAAQTAIAGMAQGTGTMPVGTPATGELPVEGTPAAFLPLVRDPANIDQSDLENLKIAGVAGVENPGYEAQLGSPTYLPNFAHAELGCNWLGLAGQVFDLEQQPVKNLIVEVGGQLNGADLPVLSLTGLAPQYGPGGYEVTLTDRPAASRNSLWVQVFDLSGRPLSEMVYFDTFAGCGRNLILFNFAGASSLARIYLPSLLKDRLPAR